MSVSPERRRYIRGVDKNRAKRTDDGIPAGGKASRGTRLATRVAGRFKRRLSRKKKDASSLHSGPELAWLQASDSSVSGSRFRFPCVILCCDASAGPRCLPPTKCYQGESSRSSVRKLRSCPRRETMGAEAAHEHGGRYHLVGKSLPSLASGTVTGPRSNRRTSNQKPREPYLFVIDWP